MVVETSAAEGWVRPGVFFGESAAGEGRRAFAGGTCTTRCLQRGEQRTKASPRTLAISYSVSDGEGRFE